MTSVYVLRGTNTTVRVHPSQLHPGTTVPTATLLAGPGRRFHLPPLRPARRTDDDLALALLGAL